MIPAGELSRFQDAFASALAGEDASTIAKLVSQPGFAVYRNTVTKGCVDALVSNFPAVTRLVGEEWMRAAATIYARAHPPRDPRLMLYGDGFAGFLAAFEPARELAYLPGVARLDYAWCESHVAVDAPALCGSEIAARPQDVLARTMLVPHPAARWAWFENDPIAAIWRANRGEAAPDLSELPWRGGGVLITRPRGVVTHIPVDRATCAFLDACRRGEALGQAALAALAADGGADFVILMSALVEAGAFTETVEQPEERQ
jgi:hypothetical protein